MREYLADATLHRSACLVQSAYTFYVRNLKFPLQNTRLIWSHGGVHAREQHSSRGSYILSGLLPQRYSSSLVPSENITATLVFNIPKTPSFDLTMRFCVGFFSPNTKLWIRRFQPVTCNEIKRSKCSPEIINDSVAIKLIS